MINLSIGQKIVLNAVMSEYPDNYNFEDILELIKSNSQLITIWKPFESFNIQTFCDFIEELAIDIDSN